MLLIVVVDAAPKTNNRFIIGAPLCLKPRKLLLHGRHARVHLTVYWDQKNTNNGFDRDILADRVPHFYPIVSPIFTSSREGSIVRLTLSNIVTMHESAPAIFPLLSCSPATPPVFSF